MSVKIFPTLKNYKKEYLPKDILSGIIMAAVSIPISMGYAQIAGVPAVYGLYGSVLPILLFAMLSTSKQFIFGVDAAPAAIVGAALATLGVTAESAQALQYVPLIALFTGLWLLLFYLLHADKIVDFISTPQNLMAEMVQELQEKDRQLLSFQEQNQSLQILNSELSGLLNLLPDTEELLSQIEQQKNRIEQLETENQQWQELTQKLNNENSLLLKQSRELLTLNSR